METEAERTETEATEATPPTVSYLGGAAKRRRPHTRIIDTPLEIRSDQG